MDRGIKPRQLVARRPLFLALSALCYLCCVLCVVGGGLCQCVYYLRGDGPIHDNGLSRVDVMDEKVPTALVESRETPRLLFSGDACRCGHVTKRMPQVVMPPPKHAFVPACQQIVRGQCGSGAGGRTHVWPRCCFGAAGEAVGGGSFASLLLVGTALAMKTQPTGMLVHQGWPVRTAGIADVDFNRVVLRTS